MVYLRFKDCNKGEPKFFSVVGGKSGIHTIDGARD